MPALLVGATTPHDGIEVVEFVRAQDRLKSLPILIVTTRADDESRARAFGAGATRFMTKPFKSDFILAELRSLVSGARSVQG